MTSYAQIGEGEAVHAAPALRRSIAEIVAEYDAKTGAIPEAIAAFETAETAINMAGCIGGTFGGPIFSRSPSLYERDVRAALLKSAWRHVRDGLRIEDIASARDRKRIELRLETPPPFTIEAIRDLFGDYLIAPRFHVLKGLAECFCDLDPAYRSHSKVKIGVEGLPKRIIVGHVSDYGEGWGNERVRDTFNALRLYRGQPRYEWAELRAIMDEAKRHGEADWCGGRIKRFKNGNAHVAFDRQGRLDVNRALAEFYGEVLPDAPTEDEAKRPSTEVARDLQFYWTPESVAETVIAALPLRGGEAILEPSCGDGRIMDVLARWHEPRTYHSARERLRVTGIEYDSGRAEAARAKGHHVMRGNFLQVAPDPRFDAVVMNPPFYGRHYRLHVDHALRFVRPGGRLACILPATAHYDHGFDLGEWRDLPVGSFAASGTNVPTGYCIIRKPG
jgi:hypothetical protein